MLSIVTNSACSLFLYLKYKLECMLWWTTILSKILFLNIIVTLQFRVYTSMPGEMEVVLKYAKITEKAFPPTKGSSFAAGYDLKSAYDYIVPARGKQLVKTDLQIELPHGCYGRIAPRSGLAWKHFIDVGAGVIDEDYRGNIGILLFNHSDDDFEVKRGDRVAQIICERIYYPALKELVELNNTQRGDGGFGSTGKN